MARDRGVDMSTREAPLAALVLASVVAATLQGAEARAQEPATEPRAATVEVESGARDAPPSDTRIRRVHRAFEWSTAGALALVAGMGTIAAINQPTVFGDGRCYGGGDPIFASYGCDGFSLLHGLVGVVSTVLYVGERTIYFARNPIPVESRGTRAYAAYRALGWVHLAGMILMPVLGLVAANPQIFGAEDDKQSDFSRALRTTHVFVGIVTGGAYVSATILDLQF